MTFSYDPDLIIAEPKDQVRFLVGDTDVTEPLMQDEEVLFVISQWGFKGSPYYAAAMCAKAIAAKFAREVNYSDDADSLSLDGLQQKFLALATDLMGQYNEQMSGGQPFVGGITYGEQMDGTVVPPSFGKGMSDDPETASDYGDWREEQVATGNRAWTNPYGTAGGW